MPGADIVTGFVKDGVAELQDRHSVEKALPPIDDCQDWILKSGNSFLAN